LPKITESISWIAISLSSKYRDCCAVESAQELETQPTDSSSKINKANLPRSPER
jgi:hypothetical protein